MTNPTLALPAALALALVLSTAAPAAAQSAASAPRIATLSVTGEGSVTRAPDRALLSLRIETNGEQSAAATSANQTIANALTKRLAALNVPATAIATTGYGLTYTPRPPRPDPASPQRFGYTVERSLTVTLEGIDGAGPAIDAAVAAGVSNVDGVTFTLRDPGAAQRGAQAAALADAMAQARGLAAAAHVRLVRILSIAPGGGGQPAPRLRMMALAAPAVPTSIAPGDLSVSANVTLRYEIAPDPR
jgi:uncharacterized protein YggE